MSAPDVKASDAVEKALDEFGRMYYGAGIGFPMRVDHLDTAKAKVLAVVREKVLAEVEDALLATDGMFCELRDATTLTYDAAFHAIAALRRTQG
jgi:hypothetical protein